MDIKHIHTVRFGVLPTYVMWLIFIQSKR